MTDLRRYKRAREAQTRRRAAAGRPPAGPREPILGTRPRAGVILALVIAVLAALTLAGVLH